MPDFKDLKRTLSPASNLWVRPDEQPDVFVETTRQGKKFLQFRYLEDAESDLVAQQPWPVELPSLYLWDSSGRFEVTIRGRELWANGSWQWWLHAKPVMNPVPPPIVRFVHRGSAPPEASGPFVIRDEEKIAPRGVVWAYEAHETKLLVLWQEDLYAARGLVSVHPEAILHETSWLIRAMAKPVRLSALEKVFWLRPQV